MISVILLNYYSTEQVYQFVCHLKEYVKETLSFVIVDNSEDEQQWKQLLQAFDVQQMNQSEILDVNKQVLLVRNHNNAGYARGNNLGIRKAKEQFDCDYVLVSNCDLRLRAPISFLKWQRLLTEHKEIAVIGPKIESPVGEQQSPCREMSFWERWCLNLLAYPFNRYIYKREPEVMDVGRAQKVYRVQGSFLFCDYGKFAQVGMFDEYTFLYGEEMILAQRLLNHGMCMYYEPQIVILHEHNQVIGNYYSDKKRDFMKLKSELYFYRTYKKMPGIIKPIAYCCLQLYYWKKIVVEQIKSKLKHE